MFSDISPRLPAKKSTNITVIETTGKVFTDGTCLELVLTSPCDSVSLLQWNGGSSAVANSARVGSAIYHPSQLNPSFLRAISLPSGVAPYGSTKILFDSISDLFETYASAPKSSSMLLSTFVLATWLVDRLPSAPSLLLVGPEPRVATLILRLISLVSRRGLYLRGITTAGVCSLPCELIPTLSVDVRRVSKKLLDLLWASANPDCYVSLNGRLSQLYFARAMYIGGSSYCRELGGAIEITVSPSQDSLPQLDAEAKTEILNRFQNQLLCYRLTNLAKVSKTRIETAEFSADLQDQATNFATSIVDEPKLRQEVLSLLDPQDRDLRSERSTGLHAAIIEALLAICHENQRTEVHVQEIADLTNRIWLRREGRSNLEARKVGALLRELGLFTTRLDRLGRGITFLTKTREKVHRLARQYSVVSISKPFPRCKQCAENERMQPQIN